MKWYGQHFFSRSHTESHRLFLENLMPSVPHPASHPSSLLNLSDGNAVDFGPGNSLLGSNEVDSEALDVLPANFDTASFLTPEMVKYHKNEHERPGYGIACIVHDAFSLTEDVSTLTPEEVQFHIDACRLCIEITRTKVCTLGTPLDEIITYFTYVPKSGVQSSASEKEYVNRVSLRLQQNLPNLDETELTVIRKVLGDTFDEFPPQRTGSLECKRGLFFATRPPVTNLNSIGFISKAQIPSTRIYPARMQQ
jgi:hypothetical protein